ncbi:MAG: flagellar basal body-associated FliL family protein [Micavibrio sp.]|nr:flagellar basal body-associated FliL family protein [Micavibrio sp.]
MRMIMIALAAVVLLGGGGAGAYFYLINPAEAAVGEDGLEESAEAHDEHASAKKSHDKGGHDNAHFEYVELDPLILPIVDENGVSQVVSVVIALEVPSAAAKASVDQVIPRLKDAFIQDMYGSLNEHASLKGGVIQVQKIKKRLSEISMDIAGEENVYDVLLQVVQQRPI